jgi:hypothetical protein
MADLEVKNYKTPKYRVEIEFSIKTRAAEL